MSSQQFRTKLEDAKFIVEEIPNGCAIVFTSELSPSEKLEKYRRTELIGISRQQLVDGINGYTRSTMFMQDAFSFLNDSDENNKMLWVRELIANGPFMAHCCESMEEEENE